MSARLFGELRSLLQGAPSKDRWEQLCALCEQVSGPVFLSQWVPYIHAQTIQWPDVLMRAPRTWCTNAARGDDDALAWLHIARDVAFSGTHQLSQLRMAQWIDAGLWGRWTRVHIKGAFIPREHIKGLWANTPLTHLSLDKTKLGWSLVEALAQDLGESLESLAITHEYLGDERGQVLCEMHARPHTLDLTNNGLSDSFVEDAITTGVLAEVESLLLSENKAPSALSLLADTDLEFDEVVLHNMDMTDEALWFGSGSSAAQWRVLDVSDNGLSEHGIETLGEIECLHSLEVLDLSLNPLMEGVGLVPLLPCAPHLRDLTMINSGWVDDGVLEFVRNAHRFKSLKRFAVDMLELNPEEQLIIEQHPVLRRALERA